MKTFTIAIVMLFTCVVGWTQQTTGDSSRTGSTEEQLKQIEQDWAKATLNKDRSALDRIEANDYIFVDDKGKLTNKQQDLDGVASAQYTTETVSDMKVREYGNCAVVIGVVHAKGTYGGKDVSGDFRFTDVFVKDGDQWKAVSSQSAKMTPTP